MIDGICYRDSGCHTSDDDICNGKGDCTVDDKSNSAVCTCLINYNGNSC